MSFKNLNIAIVHEWFITYAGAEKVVEQLCAIFPNADVFCVIDFLPEKDRAFLKNKKVTTSFIQKLPFVRKHYQKYLPLMPLAIEQFDLSAYDLIISSNHAVAKGVIIGPQQTHICYVHSPMRYAWDLQHQYLRESGCQKGLKSWLMRYLLHRLRKWDVISANRVDYFIANSNYIKARIKKVYRRESSVIFPPVNLQAFSCNIEKQDFYLTASRLVPYKRVNLIVQAFTKMPDKKLVVIGDGAGLKKLRSLAKGKDNIQVLGYQENQQLIRYLHTAKAFVYAAEEDFGILPVEAQACGTPIICYGKGGVQDTVIHGKTGIFFAQQTDSAIIQAVQDFEQQHFEHKFEHKVIREQAEKFSQQQFKHSILQFVEQVLPSNSSKMDY